MVTYTAQERTVTVTYHDDKGVELREAYTLNTTYGSSYNVGDQISDTLDVGGHHYIKESVTGEVSGTCLLYTSFRLWPRRIPIC